jgi:hypothetical protein
MRSWVLLLLLGASGMAGAQASLEPLNHDFSDVYDPYLNDKNSGVHTAIKPYLQAELDGLADSVLHRLQLPYITRRDTAKKKNSGSTIEISPVFTLLPGYSIAELKPVVELGGGLRFSGRCKKKFACEAVWLGGRSSFADYIDSTVERTHTVPGMGYAYGTGPQFSYQYISGYLSYSPNTHFNFQAGYGKHFWGDGYRSLFLSDISNAYPFAKITARVWHLNYTVLYAMHQDITAGTGLKADAKNKFGTFHYLSWNLWKRLNIGFFESIVWQGNDPVRSRSYDINYLDPIIFFRPVEFSLGSADNALLGGSFKVKIARKQQAYGQVILDEFLLKEILARKGWWANKQGVQLGFRSFDVFKVKGLDARLEFNYVRPYTYSHGSVQQNYGHFGMPLAHPVGANFEEFTGIATYRMQNWLFECKAIYLMYGADTAGLNFGQNIFLSYMSRVHDYDNYLGQGAKTEHICLGLRAAYLLTKHSNIEAEAGLTLRAEVNPGRNLYTVLFYAGIKTALWNTYRDF